MADLLLLKWVVAILDPHFLELLDIVGVNDSVAASCEQLVKRLSAPLDCITNQLERSLLVI